MKLPFIDFGSRSTVEIVVLIFTGVVSFALLALIVGAVLMRLIHPEAELKPAAELVTNILSMIVGALVSFMGGRAYGKWEAQNGDKK